jgi:hypothetical protein
MSVPEVIDIYRTSAEINDWKYSCAKNEEDSGMG